MDRHRLKIYDDEHLASFLFSLCWLPNLGLSVAVIIGVTSQASDLRPTTRVQHVASHFPFRSEILYGYSPTCIKRGSDNASISQKVRREESLRPSSSHRACLESPWPFTRATAGQRLSHVTYSSRSFSQIQCSPLIVRCASLTRRPSFKTCRAKGERLREPGYRGGGGHDLRIFGSWSLTALYPCKVPRTSLR